MKNTPRPSLVPVSDDLWERVRPLIPPHTGKKKPGRPRMDDRQAFNAILYICSTGCAWKSLPKEFGASSTVHDRFQYWRQCGLIFRLRQMGILPRQGPAASCSRQFAS